MELVPCLIFRMIFEEKYFSSYVLLIYEISLSGGLYFVRYLAICVLQLFVNQVVTSQILKLNLIFLIKSFLYHILCMIFQE